MSSNHTTIVSAPGKVLLAGGYLVLDRSYSGLVVATSSRFYTSITSPSSSSPLISPSPLGSSVLPTALPSSSSAQSSNGTQSLTLSATSSDETQHSSSCEISVRAGQFSCQESTWTYSLSFDDDKGVQVEAIGEGKNKFIEITLTQTLRYVRARLAQDIGSVQAGKELRKRSRGIQVVVLADNDFYSQREQLSESRLPPRISSLASLRPFHPLPRPIHKTNKTGLGSSAALVTSLVAGLLQHLGVISIPSSSSSQSETLHHTSSPPPTQSTSTTSQSETLYISSISFGLDIVHSLAQFAHCLAQGKVGSGFDVSSAVYGTHIYRRFSPSILSQLMNSSSSSSSVSSSSSSLLISSLDPIEWDQQISPFRLPSGLRLMLADVDAGTDTPSFVGRVLKWREAERDPANDLWGRLDQANRCLEDVLSRIAGRESASDYMRELEQASRNGVGEKEEGSDGLVGLLGDAKTALNEIRRLLREMSDASQVPIEPPEQTRLLDACSACSGVIGGGVPGAGGYDAIFLLVIDQPGVIQAVEDIWASWTEMSVCPLLASQSDGGLRLESLEAVRGLKEALER
ncbi:hypothetical protein BCR39DRAFT_540302 [Naematelia encephala]|uniref:phosphomevalonate kinase n=1 Tax=Naematelia encephala TaxID=71784 RepID=A0A1Y2AW62_9TREE|nr:hypothetical protein BCR39DRAFT_540302 [Naematelia encephala]